jgi:hypothetical protein
VIPRGTRYPSGNTSPEWIGATVVVRATMSSSVLVDDLDLFRTGRGPAEADALLVDLDAVLDADAVLASSIAPELLEPVARKDRSTTTV